MHTQGHVEDTTLLLPLRVLARDSCALSTPTTRESFEEGDAEVVPLLVRTISYYK